jgi:hypothetical protein
MLGSYASILLASGGPELEKDTPFDAGVPVGVFAIGLLVVLSLLCLAGYRARRRG